MMNSHTFRDDVCLAIQSCRDVLHSHAHQHDERRKHAQRFLYTILQKLHVADWFVVKRFRGRVSSWLNCKILQKGLLQHAVLCRLDKIHGKYRNIWKWRGKGREMRVGCRSDVPRTSFCSSITRCKNSGWWSSSMVVHVDVIDDVCWPA